MRLSPNERQLLQEPREGTEMGFMPPAPGCAVVSQHNAESHLGSGQFSHLYGGGQICPQEAGIC